jgi:hypothetical protein
LDIFGKKEPEVQNLTQKKHRFLTNPPPRDWLSGHQSNCFIKNPRNRPEFGDKPREVWELAGIRRQLKPVFCKTEHLFQNESCFLTKQVIPVKQAWFFKRIMLFLTKNRLGFLNESCFF